MSFDPASPASSEVTESERVGSDRADQGTGDSQPRTCFYCGAPADGKPFKVSLHHVERHEEAFVNAWRCRRCERRHDAWLWVAAAGLLILLVGSLLGKTSGWDFAKVLLVVGVLLGVAVMAGSKKAWGWYLSRFHPQQAEERAHEHPMVRDFLADGFELGTFPRDEQGEPVA
jgi:hypothetical protein